MTFTSNKLPIKIKLAPHVTLADKIKTQVINCSN